MNATLHQETEEETEQKELSQEKEFIFLVTHQHCSAALAKQGVPKLSQVN